MRCYLDGRFILLLDACRRSPAWRNNDKIHSGFRSERAGFFNSWQTVTRFDLRSDLGVDSGVGHPLVVVLPLETNSLAPFLLLS